MGFRMARVPFFIHCGIWRVMAKMHKFFFIFLRYFLQIKGGLYYFASVNLIKE